MIQRGTVKFIVRGIVGLGVAKIVRSFIKENTTPKGIKDKVTMRAGSLVMGAMAADSAKSYTDAKIDKWYDAWEENAKNSKARIANSTKE